MYLPRVRSEFLIRGREVLALGPAPYPQYYQNWDSFVQCQEVMPVYGSRPNPGVQIFPPEYLGTYAL
jgi:hypothetical protein